MPRWRPLDHTGRENAPEDSLQQDRQDRRPGVRSTRVALWLSILSCMVAFGAVAWIENVRVQENHATPDPIPGIHRLEKKLMTISQQTDSLKTSMKPLPHKVDVLNRRIDELQANMDQAVRKQADHVEAIAQSQDARWDHALKTMQARLNEMEKNQESFNDLLASYADAIMTANKKVEQVVKQWKTKGSAENSLRVRIKAVESTLNELTGETANLQSEAKHLRSSIRDLENRFDDLKETLRKAIPQKQGDR